MRVAGAACLAAHLLGLGWLAPFLTALVAASDHDHRVLLSVNGEGARVVLAHDAARRGMEPGHEHCPVAAFLVALASESPGGGDHVLSFPSGIELGRASSRASVDAPAPSEGRHGDACPGGPSPGMDSAGPPLPLNPPRTTASSAAVVSVVRSTILRC
jgi:hypothetical protein